MSGYKKVLAAREKVKGCQVQHMGFGGVVGDTLNGGGVRGALTGGAIMGPTGAIIGATPGAFDKIGGAISGLNPYTALKNNYQATAPVIPQQNWQPGMNQGQQMVTQGVGDAQSAIGGLNRTAGGLQGLSGQQVGVAGNFGSLAQQQQNLAAGFGGLGFQNQNNLAQQQALANQLQAQALGQGPNPAQLQYQQNVDQAIQQNAGMIASQRGINPALAARMGAQSAGQMTQQAAGNAAVLQAQQQLAAQQALGQQQQAIGNTIQGGGGLLGSQIGALGQAGSQYGNQVGALGAAGNTLGSAGNAYGNAGQLGGQIAGVGNTFYGTNVGGLNAQNALSSQGQLGTQAINAGVASGNTQMGAGITGGLINAIGGAAGAAAAAAHGGEIPGQPRVQGDSPKNDTVPTMLSPGEIVIPRSIVDHPHAPYLAADFVREVLSGRGPKPQYAKMADGGEVEQPGLWDRFSNFIVGGAGPAGQNSLAGEAASIVPAGLNAMSQHNRDLMGQSQTPTETPGIQGGPNMTSMAEPNMSVDQPQAPFGGKVNLNTLDPSTPPQPAPQVPGSNVNDAYSQAFKQQEAGAKGFAAASQTEANTVSKAYGSLQQQQQAAQAHYQESLAKLDKEQQDLTNQVTNGKIDPNHYWSSMSTGNKVMAAIGVALSGIGSGLTGQKNLALEVINKAIDADIDSQKSNLGKTQSLLSQNLQKYGRLDAAYQATAMQQISIVQGQVAAAAAKAGGEKAQAQAQQIIGQLGIQKAQLQQQVATHELGLALGSGAGTKANLNLEALPKEYRDRAVQLPNGGIALARNEKDAGEVQQSLSHAANLNGQLGEALKFVTSTGRTLPGTEANAKASVLHDSIVLSLNKLHDLNRLTDIEHKDYENMVPDPGAWRQDVAIAKLHALQGLIQNKLNGEYTRLEGYNPGKSAQKFQTYGQ